MSAIARAGIGVVIGAALALGLGRFVLEPGWAAAVGVAVGALVIGELGRVGRTRAALGGLLAAFAAYGVDWAALHVLGAGHEVARAWRGHLFYPVALAALILTLTAIDVLRASREAAPSAPSRAS